MLRRNEHLARSTVDALPTHIAILDDRGIIVALNRAWREFADQEQGFPGPSTEGANYLMACDAAGGRHNQEAITFAAGIRAVLAGKQEECSIEYAAHTATQAPLVARQRNALPRLAMNPPVRSYRTTTSPL